MADAPPVRNASRHIQAWVEPLLWAAKELGVQASSEWVKGAAAWGTQKDVSSGIIEVASQSGLLAHFVHVPATDLNQLSLPALCELRDGLVAVITSVEAAHAHICVFIGGQPLQRRLALKALPQRFLLVQERTSARSERASPHLPKQSRQWFREIFTSHGQLMFELCAGSLFGNLLAISTALFAMQVWDRVVPARSTHTLWVLMAGVAAALMLEFTLRMVRSSMTDHFGKRADLKLSSMFFARLLDIRNDVRPRSPGSLIAQMRDLEQLRELLTSSVLGVLIDLPFVMAFLGIIWLLGGWLVLVPLAVMPLLILPGVLAQWPLSRLSQAGMSEATLRNAILMEAIYRAEDIKTLQAEPRFRQLWAQTNRVSADIALQQRHWSSGLMYWTQVVQQSAYVGVIAMGVYAILDGSLSMGAVMACSMLTSRTIAPLAQIPTVLGRLQNARMGKQGLDQLMDLPLDHEPTSQTYHRSNLLGQYEFENVTFGFDPQEKPVLTIEKLTVKPGERIAVLGRVGAGKSTLLRVLAGLATPQQGRVLFNGTPMHLIDVSDVRRDVGVAMQEASLFYGTLRDNLLLAQPMATDEQLLEAMRLSCADQLLLQQPHGLDLMLRESGAGLSGGQKQALILARTFLRSPNVLLLDEPTASLDEATERRIIQNLTQWLGPRTLIVATHRYPLLAMVDRIIVIDGGRIVRDGPRDEVIAAMKGTQATQATQPASAQQPSQTPQKPVVKPVPSPQVTVATRIVA